MEKEAGETDRQTEETLKVRDEEEKLKDLGRERLREHREEGKRKGERWGGGRGEERGARLPQRKGGAGQGHPRWAEAEGSLEPRVHTEMGGLGRASCPVLSPKVTLNGGEESVWV